MNKFTKYILLGVVVTVVAASFIWLRGNNPLFNLFFPPSGLYEPLAMASLENDVKRYSFNIKHPYPGNYVVAIQAPTSPGVAVNYEIEFDANTVFKYKGGEVLNTRLNEPYQQFWTNIDGGIVLANYRIPELAPKEELVEVVVNISGNVNKFNETYGASKIEVRKWSDK